MIQDKTIDETLVELARTMKALQALRAARNAPGEPVICGYGPDKGKPARKSNGDLLMSYPSQIAIHAAVKRASLDLTRKLSDLRASR